MSTVNDSSLLSGREFRVGSRIQAAVNAEYYDPEQYANRTVTFFGVREFIFCIGTWSTVVADSGTHIVLASEPGAFFTHSLIRLYKSQLLQYDSVRGA